MPNYYEILQVAPTASVQEIEVSLDRLYNDYRRKVTNFDPQVAAQAGQALQVIEQMRGILLSPDRRGAYDAALGIGTSAGGLFDPQAVFSPPPQPPPGPALGMPSQPMHFVHDTQPRKLGQQPVPIQPSPRTDAWVCPGCGNLNLVGAQFCAKDGTKIGHPCPQCGKMAEFANPFCPECGANKRDAYDVKKQAEIRNIKLQLDAIEERIERVKMLAELNSPSGLNEAEKKIHAELRQGNSAGCMALITLVVIAGIIIGMIGSAVDSGAAPVVVIFALILGGIFAAIVSNNTLRGHARGKAKGIVSDLEKQIPPLQQQIDVIDARQYPN